LNARKHRRRRSRSGREVFLDLLGCVFSEDLGEESARAEIFQFF
jgi:hypothetical protein